VAGKDRAAAVENNSCPVQQTLVPRNVFAQVRPNSDSTEASNMTTYTDFQNGQLQTSGGAAVCTSGVLACGTSGSTKSGSNVQELCGAMVTHCYRKQQLSLLVVQCFPGMNVILLYFYVQSLKSISTCA